MGRYPFFVFVFCGVFLPSVLCFVLSSIDCDTMLPNNGYEPQKSSPPFFIAVSFDKYSPGNEIQVTLEGTEEPGFQAFLLQARELEGDIPIGSFKIIDSNTQAFACHNVSNSTVIHTNSEAKQKISTIWIAPSDTKKIQFRATVVQDSETFWVGVRSKTITAGHSRSANATEKRNRKKASRILLEIDCTKKGGTYSSSSGCVQSGSSGSSQTNYAIGQVGVIYPGGSRGGCPPGAGGVYSKYGCGSGAASVNTGVSYGESISSGSGSAAQKPVSYPDSNPYPPPRDTFPSILANSGRGTIIHSQSSSSQLSSSQSGVIIGQGGQRGNPCDRSSPSYNIVICKLRQTSTSQNSNTNGQSPSIAQGNQQGGSTSLGGTIICGKDGSYGSGPCLQDQSSTSQNSNINGQSQSVSQGNEQGGSTSLGGIIICGEDGTYGSGPCLQPSSQSSSNLDQRGSSSSGSSSPCGQSSSSCAGSKVIVARDTSRALNASSYNKQNESSTTNSSSTNVQGESFISFSNNSNVQGSSFLGPKQSGGQGSHSSKVNQFDGKGSSFLGKDQYGKTSSAGKQSSPGLLLLFSVLSVFAISSSFEPKWFM